MIKDNIIQRKSYDFALKSISLYKKITSENKEYVLSKQFLRSSTSIGANVEETIGAQSERDFLSKISISYKRSERNSLLVAIAKR